MDEAGPALAELTQSQEDYRLDDYYRQGRAFLARWPAHPESDRVRYELAAQLVAANLETPTSTAAALARTLLEEHSRAARSVEGRFEAELLLLKFSPQKEHQHRGEAMLRRFPGYADLDQVYLFLVESALLRADLKGAADYARAILERFPGHADTARMRDLIRRGGLTRMPYGLPELRPLSARFEGKVVLVDFFATWCRPCISELPRLAALYRRFGGPDFEILSISIDEDPAAYQRFLEAARPEWSFVRAPAVGSACGVTEMPSYFVVDRQGNIVSTELRGAALFTRLEALITDRPGAARR